MLYRAENLSRVHGARTVLDIDRLDIEAHKIYTLIGPNGAGKTSLLKILAFLDRPTGGTLRFLDRQVEGGERQLVELRRQVVLLDQNPIMFTGSVCKNIEFGLKVRKVPPPERRRRIAEVLELVGMASFADYNARSLSGGETKRVALARALVLQPEVLLCDEPTANVDGENQEIILNIIERINREHGTSLIFSTHYLSQGQRLADHTLLLQHGKLSGLGNENVFRATIVDRRDDRLTCRLIGQQAFDFPAHLFPADAKVVRVHIDPGAIRLNPGEPEAADSIVLRGHVTGLDRDNGRVRITVDCGIKLMMFLALDHYRRQRPGIGDDVRVSIPPSAIDCSRLNPL